MSTIAEQIQQATAALSSSDSPRLDAEVLLCHVLGKPRSYLYTWPERELAPEELARFDTLLARRAKGEPVAHITGQREFWSLNLKVTPATLIPRPDTETLVEQALLHIPLEASWEVADLGTGSGAIALAIASERPRCQVTAVERSPEALAVARDNLAALGLANVTLLCGDWFSPLAERRFQLIVSNPPYIRRDDPHLQQGDVRHEPLSALAAGIDGLDDIRHIASYARQHLGQSGWLLLEHGYDQAAAVAALLTRLGYRDVTSVADLAGHDRLTLGCYP